MKARHHYNKEETADILNNLCMAYFVYRLESFRLYSRIINTIPERIKLKFPSFKGQVIIPDVDFDFLNHSCVQDFVDSSKKDKIDELFCQFYLFASKYPDGKIIFLPMVEEVPFLTVSRRDDEIGFDAAIIVGKNLGAAEEIVKWKFNAVIVPS